jgi:gliding motility-associated-like protein
VRYLLIIVILLLPAVTVAQLSAPGMSAVRFTSYPSAPAAKDPVFIFCNSAGSQAGALTAISPVGPGSYNFTWRRWNDATRNFSDSILTESGVTTSTLSNLIEGGYKVSISDSLSTTLTGWIYIDKPFSLAQLQNRTCDYVALKGKAAIDTFYYKDPANGTALKLPDGVKFMWSSDPESSIPYPDLEINPQTFNPPLVDVTYKLQVIDSFGCSSESSFPYTSIHVKADFTADPTKGEAPLKVTFTDKSIRADIYRWEFGDGKDSISILSNPEPHTYYIPGEYSVKLTIQSSLGCVDSLRFDKIVVDPSELKIPNVFTPDGDGLNDYFAVESKSMRQLSMDVYSQSGLKVYSFYGVGEMLREWKGWDGNVNNTSVKASPGVYFYIVRGNGWDNVSYNGKEYRGFVYLYR